MVFSLGHGTLAASGAASNGSPGGAAVPGADAAKLQGLTGQGNWNSAEGLGSWISMDFLDFRRRRHSHLGDTLDFFLDDFRHLSLE